MTAVLQVVGDICMAVFALIGVVVALNWVRLTYLHVWGKNR